MGFRLQAAGTLKPSRLATIPVSTMNGAGYNNCLLGLCLHGFLVLTLNDNYTQSKRGQALSLKIPKNLCTSLFTSAVSENFRGA